MADTKVNNRLALFMKMKDLNASQLADNINVQRSAVSHILNARNKPSIDFLMKLKSVYNELSIDWLLTGKQHGDTDVNRKTATLTPLDDTNVNIDKTLNEAKMKQNNVTDVTSDFDTVKELAQKKAPEKALLKVMMFYSDGTFQTFTPDEQR